MDWHNSRLLQTAQKREVRRIYCASKKIHQQGFTKCLYLNLLVSILKCWSLTISEYQSANSAEAKRREAGHKYIMSILIIYSSNITTMTNTIGAECSLYSREISEMYTQF
jgi:hypothetical protein